MEKQACLVVALLVLSTPVLNAQPAKALEVIAAAVEAMGGKAYLDVRNSHSSGRYFIFDREGRKGYAPYKDWTNLEPIKWRFQLWEGKKQSVEVYNLELGKGWKLEGRESLEEAKSEDVEAFRKSASRDLDILLKKRLKEEGMNLYYYGPDDVAGGGGSTEAVEFLDSTNQSVVVFFDLKTHLPVKLEAEVTDRMGLRHKEEVEFFNWHTIQNVHTPLRVDASLDGQPSQQRFVEKIEYNLPLSEDLFLEPRIEKKK